MKVEGKKLISANLNGHAYGTLQKYLKKNNTTVSSIFDKITRDLVYCFEQNRFEKNIVLIQFNDYEGYSISNKFKEIIKLIEDKQDFFLNFLGIKKINLDSIKDSYGSTLNFISIELESSELNTSIDLFKLMFLILFEKKFEDTYNLIEKNKLDLMNDGFIFGKNQKEAIKKLKEYLFIT